MADESPQTGAPASAAGDADTVEQIARINGVTQYVKDLSFESPRAPASVLQGAEEPHGELKVQVAVRALGRDNYEIMLQFQIEGTKDGEVAFLIELHYAGVFVVSGFAEDELQPALMVECPRLLFPFARRVIADTVRDGGFPQLMLGPIDFVKLYEMHGPAAQAARRAEKEKETETESKIFDA